MATPDAPDLDSFAGKFGEFSLAETVENARLIQAGLGRGRDQVTRGGTAPRTGGRVVLSSRYSPSAGRGRAGGGKKKTETGGFRGLGPPTQSARSLASILDASRQPGIPVPEPVDPDVLEQIEEVSASSSALSEDVTALQETVAELQEKTCALEENNGVLMSLVNQMQKDLNELRARTPRPPVPTTAKNPPPVIREVHLKDKEALTAKEGQSSVGSSTIIAPKPGGSDSQSGSLDKPVSRKKFLG